MAVTYITVLIARIADQNQYDKLLKKLLGNVRITFREFGSDRIQYSKLLEMMTSSNLKYLPYML